MPVYSSKLRNAPPLQRAVASLQSGNLDEAEAQCAEILRLQAHHPDALHLRGLIALQRGDAQRSIDLIRQSLALRPAQPVAAMNLANALLSANKPNAALLASEEALALRPGYAEALNARGNALLKLNRATEASVAYEQALALRPELALLHSNQGDALRTMGQLEAALASYRRALERQPILREAQLGAVMTLHALDRLEEGLQQCGALLRVRPDDPEVLLLRAKLYSRDGRWKEALLDLDRALALHPDASDVALERGKVMCQAGRVAEGLAVYEQLRVRTPTDPDLWFNCGAAQLMLTRHDSALASFQQALQLRPDDAKSLLYHGKALRSLRRPTEALESLTRALAVQPRNGPALSVLASAYVDLGRYDEAIQCLRQSLDIDPAALDTLSHLGGILLGCSRDGEASACFERALELEAEAGPGLRGTLGFLVEARMRLCDWRDFDVLWESVRTGILADRLVCGPSLRTASALTPELHQRCARLFFSKESRPYHPPSPIVRSATDSRIRVAYLSADFREHPVSMLLASVLEHHDRNRFECIGVSLRKPDDSALARRIQGAFDGFIDATPHSDAHVAQLLRERQVDICIDLNGHTAFERSGILAHGAAPLQVNYLGFPGSVGAPQLDYIIADRTVIPESDQPHYSERVAYLPYCYLPPGDPRSITQRQPDRAAFGLPMEGMVFCAFNTHNKLTPAMFDVWMRLLRTVDGSILWLSQGGETSVSNLRQEAVKRGVETERLVFAPRMPSMEDHLARYGVADLYLDTTPYNAHTTALDALWSGLPVLTCRGPSFAGRVASSLLSALDLPELITANLADYEERARQLAGAAEERSRLRTRIRQAQAAHVVFDARRYCRHLEAAYLSMWERSQRGEGPASFAVAPDGT